MVYGAGQFTNSATIGVQQGSGQRYTQYSCNQFGVVQESLLLTFTMPVSTTPVPTNTPLPATPTLVPTATPTPANNNRLHPER